MSNQQDSGNTQIVDFNEVRAQRLDEKRRKTERIFFKQILGVYSVVANAQIRPIEIVEVSETGLSFQVPFQSRDPWPNDNADLPVRLYFSQETYLEVRVKVVNSRPVVDQEGRHVRYGCQVDQTLGSYAAYEQFVRFLKLYAEHAHRDSGKDTVFYI